MTNILKMTKQYLNTIMQVFFELSETGLYNCLSFKLQTWNKSYHFNICDIEHLDDLCKYLNAGMKDVSLFESDKYIRDNKNTIIGEVTCIINL